MIGSRWLVLCLFYVLGAWLMPPAVFAADGPPPVFYVYMKMDEDTDLVQIDTQADTLTKVMSLTASWVDGYVFKDGETLPVTVETFLPAVEWQAFQRDSSSIPSEHRERILGEMNAPGIDVMIEATWEADPGVLLIYRRFSKCYSTYDGPATTCYGMTQFSLLDIQTSEERILWQLPFHHKNRMGEFGRPCYEDIRYENFSGPISQVLLHPTRNLLAVQFHSYEVEGCAHTLFLIDYSLEIPIVTELSSIVSFAWSPDGTQMAYIEDCTDRQRACTNSYGIIDLFTLNIVFFKELEKSYHRWIAWPTADTLVFSHTDVKTGMQSILWYDIESEIQRAFALSDDERVFTIISLRSGESQIILGNGSTGYVYYPTLVFDETPGKWMQIDEDMPLPTGLSTINSDYAILSTNGFIPITLIDADLNHYPIDTLLAGYADRYGADGIGFAFVGAERP